MKSTLTWSSGKQIHDDLRRPHPEWVAPEWAISQGVIAYETRLMEPARQS